MFELSLYLLLVLMILVTYGTGLTIFKNIRRGSSDLIWYLEDFVILIISLAIDFELLWFIFN